MDGQAYEAEVESMRLVDMMRMAPKTPEWGGDWPTSNTLLHSLAWVGEHSAILGGSSMLEFGVFSGKSITKMAICFPHLKIYGFDSFLGLPESWANKLPKGHFNTCGQQPRVPRNVELISGFFQQTLPDFARTHSGPASLVHLDADLYSSTIFVLRELMHNGWIVAGTVLVFDEIVNYATDWMNDGEFKALREILLEFPKLKIECVARAGDIKLPPTDTRNYQSEQAMFRVTQV